jgi:Oxidoreductase family, NAD-binding Rossmann fold
VTNDIAAALPVRATRQDRHVDPRFAVEDSAGALRVGVVGVGEQTANHLLPALLALPKVRIAALVDPLRERRDTLADRLGVSAGFDSVAQLLAEGEVDAVVAACPPQAHEQIAAAAIDAGVPVFVEKPPATTKTPPRQRYERSPKRPASPPASCPVHDSMSRREPTNPP